MTGTGIMAEVGRDRVASAPGGPLPLRVLEAPVWHAARMSHTVAAIVSLASAALTV